MKYKILFNGETIARVGKQGDAYIMAVAMAEHYTAENTLEVRLVATQRLLFAITGKKKEPHTAGDFVQPGTVAPVNR